MHPLAEILREPAPLLLIGDSANDRFPGFSYNAYVKTGRPFYCYDLGGLTESRGPTTGGTVYTDVAALPDDLGDLAVIWVKPQQVSDALAIAKEAGAKRIWFSFGTTGRSGVAEANEMGFEIVEVGRCPVYYLDGAPPVCRAHAAVARLSGTRGRPAERESKRELRVMW